MSAKPSARWGKLALLNGAVAAWLIYDMVTATEVPRQAVMVMQYVLLVGMLIGLAGSLFQLLSQERRNP
jgi:hypothetical protein